MVKTDGTATDGGRTDEGGRGQSFTITGEIVHPMWGPAVHDANSGTKATTALKAQ